MWERVLANAENVTLTPASKGACCWWCNRPATVKVSYINKTSGIRYGLP